MAKTKRAFTLIELLVVIAIIAILAAILFPVFAQAKDAAKKASSISNVKQLALAHLMYANDTDDIFCPTVEDRTDVTIDYEGSWMIKIQPYVKSIRLFYSPNAKNQTDPVLTGTAKRSNGIITQYAMIPRWRVWASKEPGSGGTNSTWRTAYGDALMDGIGGYNPSPDNSANYWGASNFCGQGGNAYAKASQSLSQSAIARVSETALIADARGFEYGFTCQSPVAPAPIDASDPSSPYQGLNFEGRYGYEGEKPMPTVNNTKYRLGTGAVAFADGSAKALKTSQFFQTIDVSGNRKAYRYQYSQE